MPTERKENSDVTSQGLSSDEKVIRAQKLIEENRKAKEAEEKKVSIILLFIILITNWQYFRLKENVNWKDVVRDKKYAI